MKNSLLQTASRFAPFLCVLLLHACLGIREDEDEITTTAELGVVWNRYGSEYGYETDIAIGGIAGEPDNRVYMCEKPGSPSAGLYKGYIEGNIITWDDVYNLPQTELEISDDEMNFYYLLATRNFAGSYKKGEWTDECDLEMENGKLVNDARSIVVIYDPAELGGIPILSLKLDNVNLPLRVLGTQSCSNAVSAPRPSLPVGSDHPYMCMMTLVYEGAMSGQQTVQHAVDMSVLKRGCNVLQLVSDGTPFGLYPYEVPGVTTTRAVTDITLTDAVSGGEVTADQGYAVTARGICWDTNPLPTVDMAHTTDGSGLGAFSSKMTNLASGKTYYVRAYATNSKGTGYGPQQQFTVGTRVGTIGPGGGYIFYDKGEYSNTGGIGNWRYLEAAPSDQGGIATWGCWGTEINGADGTNFGTGFQNTIDIEKGCTTAGTAADLCANLTLNGLSDWYLPSLQELAEMYNVLGTKGLGNFKTDTYPYWSSSEDGPYIAWHFHFNGGRQVEDAKLSEARVRAIRAF